MRLVARSRLWLRSLLERKRVENELDEEFQFHLERLVEQKRAGGVSPSEARAEALRELGGVTHFQEECRDTRGMNPIDDLLQDVRYGTRMLRRAPGFSAVAILSLALGIGANTAIFTLINAVILRRLPVARPQELVQLQLQGPRGPQVALSHYALEAFRAHTELFSGVFAQSGKRFDVRLGGEPAPVEGAFVSGDYFPTLGVAPLFGRSIGPADDSESGGPDGPIAVLGYAFWIGRFAGDRAVLGRSVIVDGAPVRIVGVMPPSFFGISVGKSPNIFVPLGLEPMLERDNSILREKAAWWLEILARKRPGLPDSRIQSALTVFWPRFMNEVLPRGKGGEVRPGFATWRIGMVDASRGISSLRRQFSEPLYILMGIVGLVLLIACANVANLLLARTSARQREVAVRLAIGATRARLIRQLLTESVMLSSFGAILGIFFAFQGCRLLVSLLSTNIQAVDLNVGPDPLVLGFTFLIAAGTGVLFGVGPALRTTAGKTAAALKDGAHKVSQSSTAAKALVVVQVALCLVLLIGAGLFVRTFLNLMNQDLGFERQNLYVAGIDPRPVGYKGDALLRLYSQLNAELNRSPMAQSASLSWLTPIGNCCWDDDITAEGSAAHSVDAYLNKITPGFFKTFGARFVLGHDFTAADSLNGEPLTIISESVAKQFFPGANPVGRRISVAAGPQYQNARIIGVVENMRTRGLRAGTEFQAYFNVFQDPKPGQMTVEVRTAKGLAAAASLIRQEVQAFNKQIPVNVQSFNDQIGQTALKERMTAVLGLLFGLLALMLACIGLYGIMSYTVVRRTNELGIRMALGAQAGDVTWMIIRETLWLAGMGAGVGILAALLCTRLLSSLSSLLFGLKPMDPVTVGGVTLLLIGLAVMAGYVPARRAARLDPAIALRNE